MQDLNDKATGLTLTADEWNEVPTELQNVIEKAGITLSGGDLDQLGKAIAVYSGASNFYSESGAADAYVCSAIGTLQAPPALHDGMVVRFRPGNANTGASTLNVNALGAKSIIREDLSALVANDLVTTRDATCRYRLSSTQFLLMNSALDPAAITNAPRGYIDGFILSNNGSDAQHDIDFAAGFCRDAADTYPMTGTAMTKKIDSSPWVAGNNNGGLPVAVSLSADTWYHCFGIRKTSDASVDYGFDTAINGAALLAEAAGYAEYRRLGAVLTDGSSNIRGFYQNSDEFWWKTVPPITTNTTVAAEQSVTLYTPLGIRCRAILNVVLNDTDIGSVIYLYSPDVTSMAPDFSPSASPLYQVGTYASPSERGYNQIQLWTDLLSGIRMRGDPTYPTNNVWTATLGYKDLRGRDA